MDRPGDARQRVAVCTVRAWFLQDRLALRLQLSADIDDPTAAVVVHALDVDDALTQLGTFLRDFATTPD